MAYPHEIMVDWVSAAFPVRESVEQGSPFLDRENPQLCRRDALMAVMRVLGARGVASIFGALDGSIERGRFPYEFQISDPASKSRLMWHPDLPHCLLEVPGRGNAMLRELYNASVYLAHVATTATRIDVTVDIQCDLTPSEFLALAGPRDLATRMDISSRRGTSIYMGSAKSDRQAVIYRYAPPHPRSDRLRIEHRFRRDRAKQMAVYIVEESLEAACAACGNLYNWSPDVYPAEFDATGRLPALVQHANFGGGVTWILKQVIPAMRRMERSGDIPDLRAFLEHYLLDEEESE